MPPEHRGTFPKSDFPVIRILQEVLAQSLNEHDQILSRLDPINLFVNFHFAPFDPAGVFTKPLVGCHLQLFENRPTLMYVLAVHNTTV